MYSSPLVERLHCRQVLQCHEDGITCHSDREEREKSADAGGYNKVHVCASNIVLLIVYHGCHGCQDEDAETGSVYQELNEPFVVRLGHHAAYPGTEVIHPPYAATNIAAVVGPVRLVAVTGVAVIWQTLIITDEYVAIVERVRTTG